MRQRAAASDLVIVNHHLLCADAAVRQSSYGEVIPTCHYAVVDEAHQLEDVATQYFGIAVSNYRLDDVGRDVERVLNAGVIADDDAAIRRQVRRVDDHARAFFGGLMLARTSRAATGERLRIGPDWYGDILNDGLALVSALDGLDGVLQLAANGLTNPDAGEDVLSLARRAAEIRDQLRFLMAASDPHHVYFIETRGRGVFLRAAPIDVADILQEVLFGRMRATILTSATLAVEGSFEYVRTRLGVTKAAEIAIPSEFDYRAQAVLYLPRRMPPPKSPEFGDAVARETLEILRRTRGRAFVLFTSYGVLRAVQDKVAPVLPYPLLVQGAAAAIPCHPAFGAAGHGVVLAGRGRRRRTVELCDHRQTALRVASRPDHSRPGGSHHRRRRRCVPRLPGAARGADHAAGTRTADPPPRRPRRARRARSTAADHGLRPAVPRFISASPGDARSPRRRAIFRGVI
jgi:ATP-dependent DNA helicase DinG